VDARLVAKLKRLPTIWPDAIISCHCEVSLTILEKIFVFFLILSHSRICGKVCDTTNETMNYKNYDNRHRS